YETNLKRRDDFVALVTEAREDLLAIYQSAQPGESKRKAKAQAIEELRAKYRAVRDTKWGGFSGYDNWFDSDINNAKLAAAGLYNDLVPQFRRLYEACGRDFSTFYEASERLAKMGRAVRRAALRTADTCL
ncbi:MAG: aminopeptidase, partial [Pseudomonadota bacterium]